MNDIKQTPDGLRFCLNVNQTAVALNLGRTRIYELVKQRKLKSFTVGSRRLFRVSDIEAFIREAANAS